MPNKKMLNRIVTRRDFLKSSITAAGVVGLGPAIAAAIDKGGNNSNHSISEILSGMDYTSFDSFAAAVQVGHELGLEIHAWVTINEDDHGWGAPAAFSRLWPELRWTRRDRRLYRSQLSLAFPKVME